MAGGTGTRLYPASRPDRPKQFLTVGGNDPLLVEAVQRASAADELYVLTNEQYADAVRELVPEAGILVEPDSKDTGPALVYAASRLEAVHGECVLWCLPSDHHVRETEAFRDTLGRATEAAVETRSLVTIGVEPDRPATGYGYIDAGEDLGGYADLNTFHEKPDSERARRLCDAGWYWNAGMFVWTPTALLDAAADSPLADLVAELEAGDPEAGFDAVDAVSIDYAVLEETDDAFVVPASFEWDDVGSWDALGRVRATESTGEESPPYRENPKSEQPTNAVVEGELTAIDASGNVVASDCDHVSLVGVEDLVVASYDDRLIVVPREDAQRVREVVATLDAADRL